MVIAPLSVSAMHHETCVGWAWHKQRYSVITGTPIIVVHSHNRDSHDRVSVLPLSELTLLAN